MFKSIIRYKNLVTIFFQDILSRYLWSLLLAKLFILVGTAIQLLSFLFVIKFFQKFDDNYQIFLFNSTVDVFSIETIVIITLLLGSIMLVGNGILYLGKVKILNLAIDHERFSIKRIFSFLNSLYFKKNYFANNYENYSKAKLRKLISRDTRGLGVLFRNFIDLPFLLMVIIFLVTILFYLFFFQTVFIFFLLLVSSYFIYHQSKKTSLLTRKMEELSGDAAFQRSLLIDKINSGFKSVNYKKDQWIEYEFTEGVNKLWGEAYIDRLKISEFAKFLNMIITIVIVIVIILFLSDQIILDKIILSKVVIYFIILKFFLMSVDKFFTSLIIINRFYPSAQRYYSFINYKLEVSNLSWNNTEIKSIKFATKNLFNSSINLQNKFVLGLIMPKKEIHKIILFCMDSIILNNNGNVNENSFQWKYINDKNVLKNARLKQLLDIPNNTRIPDMLKSLEHLKYLNKLLKKVNFNVFLTDMEWKKMNEDCKFSLQLLSSLYSSENLIIIDFKYIVNIDRHLVSELFQLLNKKLILIHYYDETDIKNYLGIHKEKIYLLGNHKKIIGQTLITTVKKNYKKVISLTKINDIDSEQSRENILIDDFS